MLLINNNFMLFLFCWNLFFVFFLIMLKELGFSECVLGVYFGVLMQMLILIFWYLYSSYFLMFMELWVLFYVFYLFLLENNLSVFMFELFFGFSLLFLCMVFLEISGGLSVSFLIFLFKQIISVFVVFMFEYTELEFSVIKWLFFLMFNNKIFMLNLYWLFPFSLEGLYIFLISINGIYLELVFWILLLILSNYYLFISKYLSFLMIFMSLSQFLLIFIMFLDFKLFFVNLFMEMVLSFFMFFLVSNEKIIWNVGNKENYFYEGCMFFIIFMLGGLPPFPGFYLEMNFMKMLFLSYFNLLPILIIGLYLFFAILFQILFLLIEIIVNFSMFNKNICFNFFTYYSFCFFIMMLNLGVILYSGYGWVF